MGQTVTIVEAKPDPDLVAHIEQLLERAKDGRIVGMAEVALYPNGMASNGWCIGQWRYKDIAVAELQRLNFELMLADRKFRSQISDALGISDG